MATTAADALSQVQKLYDRLNRRRRDIKKQFDYLRGEQSLAYASDQWRRFHAERYKGFSDNWCEVVARSAVDRMRIDGFRLGSSTDRLTPEEQLIWSDWNRNELESASNQGFLSSTVAKRSSTIVWGDTNDEPVVTWEHPSQVIVDYEPGGRRRRRALKVWIDEDTEKATLYLPDGVWKFQRPSYSINGDRTESGLYVVGSTMSMGGWEPRQEPDDDTWPLPNPLKVVPVVEWLNLPELGQHPISAIDGVMAMQDAMNLMWGYLFNSADQASMAARVVLGAEPPKVPILDEDGQVIGSRAAKLEDLAEGRMLFLPGKNGSTPTIDQWDAARLDVFTGVVVEAIGHVAAQSRTPGHYMLTNEKFANLNADALTAAEVPLATKVANQELHMNPSAKETVALMAQVRSNDALADQIRSTEGRKFVQWKDPAMHSLGQVADAATKDRAVGMSLRTVLERRYGMTEQEIDQEFDRIRNERDDPVIEQLTKVFAGAADSASDAPA